MSENIYFDVLAVLTTFFVGIIAYFKWKLTYWDRVGLPTITPTIPFGNTKNLFLGRQNLGEQFRDLYNELKSNGYKHGGVYLSIKPTYLPTDPEIIKQILLKDFQHFVNRGNYYNEENDPLTGHLFNMGDEKWKRMRVKLTPTFTSGKMKMMFQTLADCTVGLKDIMDAAADSRTPVDIKDILGRFSTDIIGSVAFGLECNSLGNPDAPFRRYGKRIFDATITQGLKTFAQFVLPHGLLRAIKYKFVDDDVEEFFTKAIRDTVEYREKNNISRKDFMNLLLQLKNRGIVADDDKITNGHIEIQQDALTLTELSAQAFVFFLAGFETSSTTMTFTLFELAQHPEIQEKLRAEVKTVLRKYDDKMTYDAIMEMPYLDKVLQETLRKHPPVAVLPRKCTKDYQIPNTSIVLKKGIDVIVPVLALHTDPDFFPDPDKFDPERFSDENKNSRPAFTFLPFGEGPRICIGMRFGLMQSKVGLITLLKNYKIKLNNRTKLPLEMAKRMFITTAKDVIWLDVAKTN